MKTLELNQLEIINGGGFCAAVATADMVLVAAGAAAHWGWIAFTPAGASLMIAAGIGLGATSLYCAFS